jgi:hypothetical protein
MIKYIIKINNIYSKNLNKIDSYSSKVVIKRTATA